MRFRKIAFVLIAAGFISCTERNASNNSIPQFLKKDVAIASGFAFDSAKPVLINPLSGGRIRPCDDPDNAAASTSSTVDAEQSIQQSGSGSTKGENSCNIQIVNVDRSLEEALRTSESPIPGKIRINGEEKDAKFVVTVTALYQGSHCSTLFVAGQQWQNCVSKEAQCAALQAFGISC